MRTSILTHIVCALISVAIWGLAESKGQSLVLGEYRGIASGDYPNAHLELKPSGRFSLALFGWEHGGPSGSGDWEVFGDSLRFLFDEESLKVPVYPESSYILQPVVSKSPNDSLHFFITVLNTEDSRPIPLARVWTNARREGESYPANEIGKAGFAISRKSAHESLLVDFVGYSHIEVPLPESPETDFEVIVFLAPSDLFRIQAAISQTRTWTFGVSYSEDGALLLANSDSSRTIKFWN